MRILIIGSGGREHAIAFKLREQRPDLEIFVAPGNGGTAADGFKNLPLSEMDIDVLVDLARKYEVDLVIPGPELPLTMGITDAMQEAGIACFGPDKFCARLEGSKSFAKEIMNKSNVPTARSEAFNNYDKAKAYILSEGAPLVIKADGLAAGKGVVVAQTVAEALQALDDIMLNKLYGQAGENVVIEEFLLGEEASFLCFCDGKTALPLPSAQDHKAVFDNDQGANTGGMGAYSPAPILPDAKAKAMCALVIEPILKTLAAMGHSFKGVLYAGLMITESGAKVLEYNTRFGDPECQPLLMRLDSDLLDIIMACIQGKLEKCSLKIANDAALGVVVAGQGYPASCATGMIINGLARADSLPGVKVFHSATKMEGENIIANGGRILCVTARGADLLEAQTKAYEALALLQIDKTHWRKDIGNKGIKHV